MQDLNSAPCCATDAAQPLPLAATGWWCSLCCTLRVAQSLQCWCHSRMKFLLSTGKNSPAKSGFGMLWPSMGQQ